MKNLGDWTAVSLGSLTGFAIDPSVVSALASAIVSAMVAICVRVLDLRMQRLAQETELAKIRLMHELKEDSENAILVNRDTGNGPGSDVLVSREATRGNGVEHQGDLRRNETN